MAEQRYQAVLAVISDGETVTGVAARFGVHRKTVHGWLAGTRPRVWRGWRTGRTGRGRVRTRSAAEVEAVIATMRSAHPGWGPRRLVHELGRAGVEPVPSESAVYRALVRLNLIDPSGRRRRDRKWKRWERGVPMELWQMDVVGGFVLADGRRAKALTGVDDHSRFCVSAHLMLRESSPNVCEGLAAALRAYGVPGQILTDNGKVFTGRFNRPPVEVLVRPDLPRERDRAPAHPAPLADHDGEDRAVPPGAAYRVPHRPGLRRPAPPRRPSSTRGSTTTTTTDPTRRSTWPPRPTGSSPVTTQPSRRFARRQTPARPAAPTRAAATGPGSPAAPAPSAWCA